MSRHLKFSLLGLIGLFLLIGLLWWFNRPQPPPPATATPTITPIVILPTQVITATVAATFTPKPSPTVWVVTATPKATPTTSPTVTVAPTLSPTPEPTLAYEEPIYLKYTIQSGDTLWDLSCEYYSSCPDWPRIYQANPYIDDPHWIYIGNELLIPTGLIE